MPTASFAPARTIKWPEVPEIRDDLPFTELISSLSFYFVDAIDAPYTFDELKTSPAGRSLSPLINYLVERVHHTDLISALLALKSHFSSLESEDDRAINDSRGFACEVVAWRFVTHLTQREAIELLLNELPEASVNNSDDEEEGIVRTPTPVTSERTPLLGISPVRSMRPDHSRSSSLFGTDSAYDTRRVGIRAEEFALQFVNLNSLEIATISEAKKFLSQRTVQRLINGIWRGDIIFWETLSLNSVKTPKLYNKKRADPYSRLRVPRYQKAFEVVFFALFLALYYGVLVEKSLYSITTTEVLLYIWIAGFAYDEFGEIQDAGQASFYTTDFWSLWDLGIVAVGTSFLILRIIGLTTNSAQLIDTAFDILALEALFLVPRICSLLSLNRYFGTLIPCLREMTKDFIKFLSLVFILYLGFLTTFTLLARDHFTLREMSWILIKVFFGSSYLGFDVAHEISPVFGPPTMLVFVCMTNILLITSLISLLSNSLTKIMDHAREEYLFIYSVYVLEASTSNRLTYYLPPLNLVPLVFRPMRLILSSEQQRSLRIVLLKITHFPYVCAIWAFEKAHSFLESRSGGRPSWITTLTGGPEPSLIKRPAPNNVRHASSRRTDVVDGDGQQQPKSLYRAQIEQAGSTDSLEALVTKLSLQVEHLVTIVEELQGRGYDTSGSGAQGTG